MLPAGTYTVTASVSGYATQNLSATVVSGADTSLPIMMGVSYGRFTGTVTDQGVAVPGAIVQAISSAGFDRGHRGCGPRRTILVVGARRQLLPQGIGHL